MMQLVADDILASKISSPLSERSVRLAPGSPIVSITNVTSAHI